MDRIIGRAQLFTENTLAAATLGNIAGRIVMVSLLSYGQVRLAASAPADSNTRRRAS